MSSECKPLPAVAMIVSLALVAGVVWADVLGREASVTDRVRCPMPNVETAAHLGDPVPYSALDKVEPVASGRVSVRVFNTTGRHGLARSVADELETLGFAKAARPANDEFYRTGTMYCVGQIRFGRSGRSAARTLSLLAPCTQLVRDGRQNSTVDLVLGVAFTALSEDY